VVDTDAVSRGSSGNRGSNRDRDIRKSFVERDLVEYVSIAKSTGTPVKYTARYGLILTDTVRDCKGHRTPKTSRVMFCNPGRNQPFLNPLGMNFTNLFVSANTFNTF